MTVAPPTSSRAMPRTALVLGANSDIARATLARLAEHGLEQVVLAARDPSAATAALAMVAPGLDATGVRWDATDATSHAGLVAGAVATLGRIDLVLCTVGVLGHGAGLEMTPVAVDEMIRVNLAGCAAALAAVAPRLADQSHGTIVVLSSVAGVRPRRSNYVYGATKAGLDAFAFGLADATTTGSVAKGAGRNPVVILERTNPGRTTTTRTPRSCSASARPKANASRPALVAPYT